MFYIYTDKPRLIDGPLLVIYGPLYWPSWSQWMVPGTFNEED